MSVSFLRLPFYLLLVFVPITSRILVGNFINGFHEYESVFLYAGDIFLLIFVLTSLFFWQNFWKNQDLSSFQIAVLAVFLLTAAASIIFAYSHGLAIYNFIRLILLVLAALAVGQLVKNGVFKIKSIFAVIAASAVFQSLIGIAQFFKQSSLGLEILGESVLGPNVGGAAKIIVEGAPILRAYGTLPHPNLLGAFLALGLLAIFYFWFSSTNSESVTNERIFRNSRLIGYSLMAATIFIVIFGLILTFSRSAWLIALLASLFSILFSIFSKQHRRRALLLLIILVASGYALVVIFNSYIIPRAQISANEPAVSQRLLYNEMGISIIKRFPLGIGIGNQVLSSVKNGFYAQLGMDKAWQWQPVHNIYLLIGSEIGILGSAALLLFLLSLVISNFKNFGFWILPAYPVGRDFGFTKTMLISLLAFGLFDHFLWTLQPGRLMLWLAIGIVIGVSSAHSTMDSAWPSLWAVRPNGSEAEG